MSNTYQPESLHPYIMNDRLKKATGSGGFELPVASADTLGGIMIGGSDNPITVTGSGNASVRKATSELLGVVKAGDGVSIDADGAISSTYDITTTEVNTHEKYKGKDIYALNIHSDSGFELVANTQVSIVELSVDTLVDAKAYETTGLAMPKSAVVDNGTFKFEAFGSFTVHDFIVKYTKPTI